MTTSTVSGRIDVARKRLVDLFRDQEWVTERVWLFSRLDRNPFMSANILLILEELGDKDTSLAPLRETARRRLASYRVGHRAYHWPVEGRRSAMANAPLFWRHRYLEISPDADCTCLVQLARRDPGLDGAIVADLAYYRADGSRFVLPRYQRALPGAEGSFLSWFPEAERCRPGKIETVDVGVDANVLWYLAAVDRLDTPGAAETVEFVSRAVIDGLLLKAPFRMSLYYPRPAVLLYLVSRAAVMGALEELLALEREIVAQLEACPTPTVMDHLCRAAAMRLWGKHSVPDQVPVPDGRGEFYVGPLLAWPLQRAAALEPLAARPSTHIGFRSEALEWALYLAAID